VTETVGPASGARGALITFGVLAAGCVVAFLPTWTGLADRWVRWSFGYDHGWLVAAVSVWLVWRQRTALAAGRPWWPATAAVLVAGFVWLLAHSVHVEIVQEIMLPLLLWCALLTVFGLRAGRALIFPIGFLYFAVPVWDYLNPFLQSVTTDVVGAWVGASGVPALIQGNIVTIPAGRFEIVSGCAGQSFFVTAGALAALYGHVHFRQPGRRLLLIGAALAVAVGVNWLRVFGVIMTGHLTDMQHYLVRVDHYTFGWVLFVIGLLPLYFLARRLENAPQMTRTPVTDVHAPSRAVPLLAALATMAIAPAAWLALEAAVRPGVPATAIVMPETPGGWQRLEAGADWRPAYQGADTELGARYEVAGGAVDLWIVYYSTQSQGRELVHYANHIAAPGRWRVERTQRLPTTPSINQAVIVDADGTRRLVRWWFEVAGKPVASGAGAKLAQAAAWLSGRRDAALVAMSVRCRGDCQAAAATLDGFSSVMSQPLRAAVGAGVDGGAG